LKSKGKVKVQEALKKLEKGSVGDKIFIYGPEDYLTEQFLKKISKRWKTENFYPENINEFFSFTGTSLFGESPVPVIVHGELLPSVIKGKKQIEKFLQKLKGLDKFIVASFSDLDYRSLKGELFSGILNLSEVVIYSDFYPESALKKLLRKKLLEKNVSDEILSLIVETVGAELRELRNETDKLLNYPGELNKEVVKLLLSSSGKVNVFELIFLLINGEEREYLNKINKLLNEGAEPLQIIGLFQTQTRQIVNVLSGRKVKLPKEVLKKVQLASGKMGILKALKLLKTLNETEFSVKMGKLTGDEALRRLIFEFRSF
jgi:DNA polymerase-3 subunit delta